MPEWRKVRIGQFLKEREGRYSPDDKKLAGLERLNKIDFSGQMHLSNKGSKTDMILVAPGDLVISGINVAKGAIAVCNGEKSITATIHYSSYTFDESQIDIEYFERFVKSQVFVSILKEQVRGGIKTEIKPKHFLPLVIDLPNIEEQKEIMSFFRRIDAEIDDLDGMISHQRDLFNSLRQAVLQEAIEGKLTAEWRKKNLHLVRGENHASKLLEKIRVEKNCPTKKGRIRKEKPLPPITDDEKNFALPDGWVWCRFGNYVLFERGRFSIRPRNDKSCYGGDYPFIQIGSLNDNGSIITDFKQTLNEKGFAVSKQFEKGTIAIAIVGGTIGNLGVLGFDMCFPDSMVGVRPTLNTNQDYTLLLLRAKQPEIRTAAYQMAGQPNIKLPTLAELVIPLPSAVEQQAIVERVAKLMAMIDGLETQVTHHKEQADLLMQSILRAAFEQKGAGGKIKQITVPTEAP